MDIFDSVALAFVAIAVATYFVYSSRRKQQNDPREPGIVAITDLDGPRGVPVLGNVLQILFSETPWHLFHEWSEKYGDTYLIHVWQTPIVVTNNVYALKHILSPRFSYDFHKAEMAYKPFEPLLGNGLVRSEGQAWKWKRGLLSPHFQFGALKGYIPIFYESAMNMIDKWKSRKSKPTQEISIDLSEEFRDLTLHIICTCAISLKSDESTDNSHPLAHLYTSIVEEMNRRVYVPFRKYLPLWANVDFHWKLRKLHKFVTTVIRDRKRSKQHQSSQDNAAASDFLDAMLSVSDDNGNRLSEKHIYDELMTMIFAGHETSGCTLTWALYYLLKQENREWYLRAQREADQLMNSLRAEKGQKFPPVEALQTSLPVLDAVLKETLRLIPPAPMLLREFCSSEPVADAAVSSVRSADVSDCAALLPISASADAANRSDTKAVRLQPGTKVNLNIWSAHRLRSKWGEAGDSKDESGGMESWDPERWLSVDEVSSTRRRDGKRHPYSYLPFSLGPRACLGQQFAGLEAKCILLVLLHNVSFSIPSTEDHRRPDRTSSKDMDWTIPIKPSGGLHVRAHLRL